MRPVRNHQELNSHINFQREGKKGNARKWPTEVTCCVCKRRFTLPFKPRKPEVYCDACFQTARSEKGKPKKEMGLQRTTPLSTPNKMMPAARSKRARQQHRPFYDD